MGYYSVIEETPTIKEGVKMVEELKKLVDTESKLGWVSYWDDMKIDENNNLEVENYDRKAYEIKPMCKWLLQFKPTGEFLLRGEEGEHYGFEFKDGKVFELDGNTQWINKGELK